MKIQHFYDEQTSTLTYLVHDENAGVVIDPVRDFDPKNGRTSWASSDKVAAEIDRMGLQIPYVIDTHAHADHMSGAPFFKERYGARTVVGSRMGEVQEAFRKIYNLGPDFPVDASQFDIQISEGESLAVGGLEIEALHTPGHTPAHMSWKLGDVVFVGDTLFAPDYGSARCDFPGGSAADLYDTIQRFYSMPDETRIFLCHDYMPGGRPLQFETTIGRQKRSNIQIREKTSKEVYVAFREKADQKLAAPALILPSVQVNLCAGELPEPEDNGTSYLKIPLNVLGGKG